MGQPALAQQMYAQTLHFITVFSAHRREQELRTTACGTVVLQTNLSKSQSAHLCRRPEKERPSRRGGVWITYVAPVLAGASSTKTTSANSGLSNLRKILVLP